MQSLHYIAIFVIGMLFIGCLIYSLKYKKSNANFPTLLITSGIAFTFLGIALGLKDFDINNTAQSLPNLINGIKTAFWGSFVGIVGAIVLKLVDLFYLKENHILSNEEAQIQKFYQEHSDLLQAQYAQHQALMQLKQQQHLEQMQLNQTRHQELLAAQQKTASNENMMQIHDAINNIYYLLVNQNNQNTQTKQEQFESLAEHLIKIHDNQDRDYNSHVYELRAVQHELRQATQHQAEKASEVITTALQHAVQNMNQGLMDHLGQNFRDFHDSMGKILVWQQQYAQHVEQQTQHYQTSAQQLHAMQQDFERFVENSKDFLEVPKEFQNFLNHATTLTELANTLQQTLHHFDEQSNVIKAHLEHYYQTMEQKNLQLLDNIHAPNEALIRFISQTKEIALDMQKMQQHIRLTFAEMRDSLAKELRELQQAQQQGLTDALNESLISLARQMGSISEKFAQDYEPITQNIKNMMQQIEKAKSSHHIL